ncbi:MAG: glycosyltransferase family 4 protein [Ignavibacteria bacterium]|nr:glycosyltransferase family 4 protein [Ignavibacteria bacterium]
MLPDKIMRINFIVPEISRTGGMRIIFEYANRLTERGHNVILYSPNIPFNSFKGMIKPYFIKHRVNKAKSNLFMKNRIPENMFNKLFDIEHLWLINDHTVRDADATIATSWTSAYVVDKLKDSKGKKFYFIQGYEEWDSNIEYADKSYTLPLQRITVSKYLKELLLEKFNSDSEVILNGIDFKVFNNPDKIFKKPKQILFTDNLLEFKKTVNAIATVKSLKLKYPDLKFKCFGIENYHPLPEYIDFIKDPDDEKIAELYRESDIFLFPVLHEGFGLPPSEAMACKCALVGNSVAAIPEFADNMVSAVLTSPENPDELLKGPNIFWTMMMNW